MKALLFVLVAGCGVEEWSDKTTKFKTYTMLIDGSAVGFKPAMDVVLAEFAYQAPYLFVEHGQGVITLIYDTPDDTRWDGRPKAIGYGEQTTVNTFTIYMRYGSLSDDEKLKQLMLLHETGHTLGLYHVDDPNNIMYPSITGACNLEQGVAQILEARRQ